jgi:hypothetical protein
MTNGAGDLPAYPVRVACSHMTTHSSSDSSSSSSSSSGHPDLWLMSGKRLFKRHAHMRSLCTLVNWTAWESKRL